MVRKSILNALAMTLIASTSYAELPYLDKAKAFANLIQNQEQQSQNIWPGFHINTFPIVWRMEEVPVYAFNFKPESSAWQPTSIEGNPVYYRPKYDLGQVYWTFMNVDGQRSFILQDDKSAEKVFRDTVYFIFKDYLRQQLPSESAQYNAYTYTGFNHIENIALSMMEYEIIHAYLLNQDVDLIKNYLAVHQTRFKLLKEEDVQFENAIELKEGTGAYGYIKTITQTNDAYFKEALRFFPKKQCTTPTSYSDPKTCLLEAIRYQSIDFGLGHALQQVANNADWTKNVESGMNFSALLTQYYPMDTAEIVQRVAQSKSDYGYDSKIHTLQGVMTSYLDKMALALEGYKQYPGIEVDISSYSGYDLVSEWLDAVYHIDSKRTLKTNYTAKIRSTNDKVHRKYNKVPFLYHKRGGEVFKMPNDTELYINGYSYTVGEFIKTGKKRIFRSVGFKNNEVDLHYGLIGTIDASDFKSVKVTFEK